ncbi:DUF1524 domain-containing protein [Cellulomonas sp. PhB150]|uniref:GmrSD restriction endonuclease domain-containing protein n=1 Tax=Cellulomonas sp. PhB150 TaxID=2485188 RepID=UPI001F200C82|nr:DUF1524 domain-containing protein [Cellulomonas sp. PhB150]
MRALTRRRVAAVGVVAVFAVAGLTGCDAAVQTPGASSVTSTPAPAATATTPAPSLVPSPSRTPVPSPTPAPSSTAGTALAAVEALDVKGRAPRTGYDRDEFGPAWQDVDRNGCDTRNDILGRDLVDVAYKARTRECVVASGTLHDRYSGDDIDFVRGQDTSTAVQIDHVVALSDAWQKGAQRWDDARRTAFANDPLNLLAADGPLNQSKGDGDAATWLPPNKAFRCEYVARQVAVKLDYDLWVTAAEHDAMVRVLSTCPAQQLPTSDPVPGPGGADLGALKEPTKSPTKAPTKAPTKKPAPRDADVTYANCAAAWAAGAAPVHEGDPGYSRKLDRDGDGVGCEWAP